MSGHVQPSGADRVETEPRRRVRPVAWVWLAALLVFAAAMASMFASTFAEAPEPPQPAANGPASLWIGVMLVPVAALLAGAATLVSLIRPGLRWAGLAGVLGFALMALTRTLDPGGDARLLGQALVLTAVACFVAATVLAFRSRRPVPRG